ncbi:inorganic triphosphatase [Agaricicola taiwanensis]|uniref:Inorganic triphosphatase n=1 Tax=Agaricicola taiwanensis TaxID=591372 RepID=A0A8J2VRX9_9RHOB|nr:CHAD domain-containing protein [Agaricicola taiwanensis]GGE38380.1 inorganic triphosphatase [Agaricicola taiwanensis]
MGDEIELKLELSPDAADKLERAGLFSAEPRTVRQRSLYFDTPDHDLSKAGLSLRIRTDGEKTVQTVKADGGKAAGLFVRPEWEQSVKGDVPVLDSSTPIRTLLGDKADKLTPIFEIIIERRVWDLEDDGTTMEIALDRGHVAVPGERQSPICEVELEQKAGSAAALFATARKMNLHVPVHLNVLSKSERGYRLLGPAPRHIKAEAMSLDADMDAATAFQHLARSCLRQFRLNETLLLERHDAEVVHQARVALRRLRSALSIHKAMLADDQSDHLRGELRWLAAKLGEVRNLDVLIDRVPRNSVEGKLEGARAEAYASLVTTLMAQRSRDLMIDLAEWISAGGWLKQADGEDVRHLPISQFAAEALDRLRKKVKKLGAHLAEASDEERHELRKAAKKLRYASEFYASLYKGKREKRRYRQFVDALKQLQDHLGELNDLATAPEVLGELGLHDVPAAALLLAGEGRDRVLDAAADGYDALVDAKRFWR